MTTTATDVVDTDDKFKIKKRWWVVVVALGIAATTAAMHLEARKDSLNTLQRILNENSLDQVKITEVWQPVWISIPGYGLLSSGGLASRKTEGTFMIARKDGNKLPNTCGIDEFAFTQTQTPDGRSLFGISGLDLFKLRACAA